MIKIDQPDLQNRMNTLDTLINERVSENATQWVSWYANRLTNLLNANEHRARGEIENIEQYHLYKARILEQNYPHQNYPHQNARLYIQRWFDELEEYCI
jgi:hypothetical protein